MIDLSKGGNPYFIEGYRRKDENELEIVYSDINENFNVPYNEHNLECIYEKVKKQLLEVDKSGFYKKLATYYYMCLSVVLSSTPMIYQELNGHKYDVYDNLLSSIFLTCSYMAIKYLLSKIKTENQLLKEYKKCLKLLEDKEKFLEEINLDKDVLMKKLKKDNINTKVENN